jgi:hypothetical protein
VVSHLASVAAGNVGSGPAEVYFNVSYMRPLSRQRECNRVPRFPRGSEREVRVV